MTFIYVKIMNECSHFAFHTTPDGDIKLK